MRVAGFQSAISTYLLPVVRELAVEHPRVHVLIREHEPVEALDLLATDAVDLALTYDYNLAPAAPDPAVATTRLWEAEWSLGVPASADPGPAAPPAASPEVFARFAGEDWIVNSRNTADEEVLGTIAALADFAPRVTHRADSLDLVEEMITAGLGVGLLRTRRPTGPGVRLLPLTAPRVTMRAYATTLLGRRDWPPLALVISRLTDAIAGFG
ncbi:LysR substrate-binding domain-containing protein [Yinghuangia aomiensis]